MKPLCTSLKCKFLVVFSIVSAIPLLIGLLVFFQYGENTIKQIVGNQLLGTVEMKKQAINQWYLETINSVEIVGRSPSVISMFQDRLDTEPNDIDLTEQRDTLRNNLSYYLAYNSIEEIFIMDLAGKIVVSTRPGEEDKIKSNRPYFQHGKSGLFVQKIYFSMTLNQSALTISLPLKTSKKTIGVLAARISLNTLSSIISKYAGLGTTGDSYIVNTHHFFVTEPRFGTQYALKKSIYTKGVNQCLDGLSGIDSYLDYRNSNVIGAYSWIAEREFCILTEMTIEEAYHPITTLQLTLYAILAILLLLGFILGSVLSRSFLKPISALVTLTQELAQGNMDKRFERKGSDEIGLLGQSFNEMANSLESFQKDLESKVKQRTNELHIKHQALKETMAELDLERQKQLKHAYAAGIAENAVSVLHNIGNTITPTIASNSMLIDRHKKNSQLPTYLRKIYDILEDQHALGCLDLYLQSDEKGKQMLPFFRKLIDGLTSFIDDEGELLHGFERQLGHIANIVSLQQKYANHNQFLETFSIKELIHDALSIEEETLRKRHIEIELNIGDRLPLIHGDKNKLAQVMLNLVKNATESIDEQIRHTPQHHAKIKVEVSRLDDTQFELIFEDNGFGADPKVIPKLFEFGFTTKDRGSGFGLHDCANFIKSNGGSIRLTSDGLGQGAKVEINFPIRHHRQQFD